MNIFQFGIFICMLVGVILGILIALNYGGVIWTFVGATLGAAAGFLIGPVLAILLITLAHFEFKIRDWLSGKKNNQMNNDEK